MDLVLAANADIARPVRTVADIRAAKAENRVGIDRTGSRTRRRSSATSGWSASSHALGVRIVQIAYMTGNLLADGCLEPRNGGLTHFGRAVIRELNRHGMLVDLSHVGDRSTLEAIDASEAPVAFTHANIRALANSPRNKTDEAMRAFAARGGVVGFTSLPVFTANDPRDATLERYLDHIEYAVNLVGIEHVGLGLDFVEGHVEGTLQPTGAALGWRERARRHGWAWPRCSRSVPPEMIRDLVYRPYADGISGLPGAAERHGGPPAARLQRGRRPRDPRRELAAPVRAGLGRLSDRDGPGR